MAEDVLRSRYANYANGKCLAVQGAVTTDGAPVFQHPCDNSYLDQVWVFAA